MSLGKRHEVHQQPEKGAPDRFRFFSFSAFRLSKRGVCLTDASEKARARQASPLLAPKVLRTAAQQEDQKQNRDWNAEEPQQYVAGSSALAI